MVSYIGVNVGGVKVLHCGDVNCSSGNVITSVDPTSSDYISLVLDCSDFDHNARRCLSFTGNPVVTYRNAPITGGNDLNVLHCGDPNCGSGNVITSPDPAGGLHTSLALDGSGNPVVSYSDTTGGGDDLKVLHCGDPNCSSGNVITSPDTAGTVGRYTSLALDVSGNPVVSYSDGTNQDLKVLHCGDASCTSGNVITSPDTGGNLGSFTSLALDSDGNPVVSYLDQTNGDLKILHCGDPYCGAAPPTNTPTGSDVCVPLAGGQEICFSEVSGGGETTVVTSGVGPPPPTGFRIIGPSGQPVYYDFNTTATFSGTVTVCIAYDETELQGQGNSESQLKLFHHDGSVFSDITTSLDTTNDIICGETLTLSPFAVMVPISPVGGIVELHVPPVDSSLPQDNASSSSSGFTRAVLVAGAAALALAVTLGVQRTRRRRVG